MLQDDLLLLFQRQPKPVFRLHLTGGMIFDIRDSDQVVVTQSTIEVLFPPMAQVIVKQLGERKMETYHLGKDLECIYPEGPFGVNAIDLARFILPLAQANRYTCSIGRHRSIDLHMGLAQGRLLLRDQTSLEHTGDIAAADFTLDFQPVLRRFSFVDRPGLEQG